MIRIAFASSILLPVLDSTSIIESKTGFYYLNAIIKTKSQNEVKEYKKVYGETA